MSLKEGYKGKHKDCVNRIRFKQLEVDVDRVYDELWNRIGMPGRRTGVSPIWKYISAVACIALLCVSSFYIWDNFRSKPLSYLEMTALAGSKAHILLPDSTEVWLNGDSWIRYPESFDDKNRSVELIGEAFFKVTKDQHRPFHVNMDGRSVPVLGTEFNVLAQKQSDVIETTLLEGSVALYKNSNKSLVPDRVLLPGEQAVYSRQSGEIEVQSVQTSFYASWVTGDYVFENSTFGQIIQVLEHSFNVKVHLKDRSLEEVCLTARFTHGESLEEILSVLQISMRYTYNIRGKDVFIK